MGLLPCAEVPALACASQAPALTCASQAPALACASKVACADVRLPRPCVTCASRVPALTCASRVPALTCSSRVPALTCASRVPALTCASPAPLQLAARPSVKAEPASDEPCETGPGRPSDHGSILSPASRAAAEAIAQLTGRGGGVSDDDDERATGAASAEGPRESSQGACSKRPAAAPTCAGQPGRLLGEPIDFASSDFDEDADGGCNDGDDGGGSSSSGGAKALDSGRGRGGPGCSPAGGGGSDAADDDSAGEGDGDDGSSALPECIPLSSNNGQLTGQFFLRYYVSGRSVGRTVACVKVDGDDVLITPGEAEERAGMSTYKNWKQSLMTVYAGAKDPAASQLGRGVRRARSNA
eukprot:85850-Chlamydomonas_euryale.AAC.3